MKPPRLDPSWHMLDPDRSRTNIAVELSDSPSGTVRIEALSLAALERGVVLCQTNDAAREALHG